jgi:hypothetical protein
MSAFKSVEESILTDMQSRHMSRAKFSVTHIGWLNCEVLLNSFIYDRGFNSDLADGGVIRDGLHLSARTDLSAATQMEWDNRLLKTKTLLKGIPLFVKECEDDVDYVILPTAEAATRIAKELSINFLNTKTVAIREALLKTGQLSPISDVVQVSVAERLIVYRITRTVQREN